MFPVVFFITTYVVWIYNWIDYVILTQDSIQLFHSFIRKLFEPSLFLFYGLHSQTHLSFKKKNSEWFVANLLRQTNSSSSSHSSHFFAHILTLGIVFWSIWSCTSVNYPNIDLDGIGQMRNSTNVCLITAVHIYIV